LILGFLLLPFQVQAATVSDYTPVSHWSLDEVSSVRYDSVTAAAKNLTDFNTVLYQTGLLSNAADFEATNIEYLGQSDIYDFDASSFSVSLWFKYETNNGNQTFISKIANIGSGESNAWGIITNNSTSIVIVSRSQGLTFSTGTLNNGTWYHLIYTYNATTNKGQVWINGVYKSVNTFTNDPANNTASFKIGLYRGTTELPFDGLIDEVSLFSSVISTSTITSLYNSGTPLSYSEPVADVSFCVYANMCVMNNTIGQSCVTDGATTTCEYINSTTTIPVEVSSDNIVFAIAVVVFLIASLWVAMVFNPFRKL